MRLAILGDIHGNLPAMQQVLQAIKGEHVDAVYCTGDLEGKVRKYYKITEEGGNVLIESRKKIHELAREVLKGEYNCCLSSKTLPIPLEINGNAVLLCPEQLIAEMF
ncbi:Calcineurin-like phosphoesterase superfamily domain-containing protein [Desulfotomaculum arcticum]|uniref:Calcineurin-like phosphoesterase superfamily domain-containing protein n=1 Tax=Desulfotruncus arcticus DSM 17038 TaxID=1121424 RepID=A0A1I2UWG9_9FIRM|nr:metallophosphoesterase family protein [Desulfotruncus arcticus]SFG81293.1 Calcineurin-like phosphoesterase superfamily domain-containing protein [Desulfotomaculum arcticum] [Desulfotruncus arcticus DSM 17038]